MLSTAVKIEAAGRRPGRTLWSYRIIGTAAVDTTAISFDVEFLFPEAEMKKAKRITKAAIRSLPPESVGTVELYIQPRQGWEKVQETFAPIIDKYGQKRSGPEPAKSGLYINWMLTIWEVKGNNFKPLMDELGKLCGIDYIDIPEQ
ncbi:MAG: hypothetical protein DRJ60_07430 [Thermoprotei archaeon]|nr:MAG: hypothetical protein DRJ60_07430 [Thermoprotei archaeon]